MNSAESVQRSFVQALLVDREALYGYQDGNDALMANNTLKQAYNTDVSPILAMARLEKGGAIDPISCYRAAEYKQGLMKARPAAKGGGSGIV